MQSSFPHITYSLSNHLRAYLKRIRISNLVKKACFPRLEGCTPNSTVAFTTPQMNIFYPLNGLADATASPVKGCHANVPSLCFPLTICRHESQPQTRLEKLLRRTWKSIRGKRFIRSSATVPGGVPQHMLRSSMCSTSKPMNQDPRETSSLAYLCSIGLRSTNHQCVKYAYRPPQVQRHVRVETSSESMRIWQ